MTNLAHREKVLVIFPFPVRPVLWRRELSVLKDPTPGAEFLMNDWQKLIADYGAMVYAAAWRILQHRQDVEDVVQETFLQAWQARQRYEVEHWGGWLRQIVVCRALDRLKARHSTSELVPEWAASGEQPSEALEATEMQQQLRQAVAGLPDRERLVFSLRYFECESNSAIAGLLSISPSAVSTALNKARARLATRLQCAMKGEPS